jgi:hypothetical protein
MDLDPRTVQVLQDGRAPTVDGSEPVDGSRIAGVEHPVERKANKKWPWPEALSDQGQHGGGGGI